MYGFAMVYRFLSEQRFLDRSILTLRYDLKGPHTERRHVVHSQTAGPTSTRIVRMSTA